MSGSRGSRTTSGSGRTVARLRAFRGIDTLTALMLHLELGGLAALSLATQAASGWA